MSSSTTAFIACSAIVTVVFGVAFASQWKSQNGGILILGFWSGAGTLFHFLNTVIWRNDALDRAPVWCDISAYFQVAVEAGLLCSCLCVSRRVYFVMTASPQNNLQARRKVAFDYILGLVLPFVFMSMHYLSADYRYIIFEEAGCFPSTRYTVVTIGTFSVPLLALTLLSAIYGVINLRLLIATYREVRGSNYLNARGNAYPYLRVMGIACLDILVTLPLFIWTTVENVKYLNPWTTWADVHRNRSTPFPLPSVVWRNSVLAIWPEAHRWVTVASACIWLGFFGRNEITNRIFGILFKPLRSLLPKSLRKSRRSGIHFQPVDLSNGTETTMSSHYFPTPDYLNDHSDVNLITPEPLTYPPKAVARDDAC